MQDNKDANSSALSVTSDQVKIEVFNDLSQEKTKQNKKKKNYVCVNLEEVIFLKPLLCFCTCKMRLKRGKDREREREITELLELELYLNFKPNLPPTVLCSSDVVVEM